MEDCLASGCQGQEGELTDQLGLQEFSKGVMHS